MMSHDVYLRYINFLYYILHKGTVYYCIQCILTTQ